VVLVLVVVVVLVLVLGVVVVVVVVVVVPPPLAPSSSIQPMIPLKSILQIKLNLIFFPFSSD